MADKFVRKSATGTGSGADWTNAYTDFSSVSYTGLAGFTLWVAAGSYTTNLPYMNNIDNVTIKRATVAEHGSASGWSDSYDGQVTVDSSDRFLDADLCDNFVIDGVSNNPWKFRIVGVRAANGMFLFEGASFTMRNIEMDGNFEWGSNEDGIRGGGIVDGIIEHCYVHDYPHGLPGHNDIIQIGDATSLILRYNIFRNGGQHAILGAYDWYGGIVNNLEIYYNVFYNTTDTGTYDTVSYNTLVFYGTSGTLKIENNTFAIRSSLGSRGIINDVPNAGGNVTSGRVWRNNICYDCSLGDVAASGTKSNNTYYNSSSTGESGELLTDPLFTNYAANDFTLQSGSPAIGSGIAAGYTVDILGNAVSNPPDRGAYQFSSGGGSSPLAATACAIGRSLRLY
jgi:hypothetical protein